MDASPALVARAQALDEAEYRPLKRKEKHAVRTRENNATSDMTADDAKNILNLALRWLIGSDFGTAAARSEAVRSPVF